MKNNPTIETIDTDFSKGRLTNQQTISLNDTTKFHGHLCDGLVVGFLGLREALYRLYPNKIIDRTNTRLISKSSPCLTDVGIYLTGGRYQFDTFYVDDDIAYSYVIQRIDNGQALGIKLKSGIKPSIIEDLGNQANQGKLSPRDLDHLQKLEDDFSEKLLGSDPKELFDIEEIENFNWQPLLKNTYIKTDVVNKKLPFSEDESKSC